MNCRSCGAPLDAPFLDLGDQPLANAYLTHPDDPDPKYPLRVRVCANCLLVQADAVVSPAELFSEYAFFSSYSKSWIDHARLYAKTMTERFGLGPDDHITEIASNDGVLLKQFHGPGVLGVEPAANVAAVAEADGIPTVTEFFGADLAALLPEADLLIANNVLGHVPDLDDFADGLRIALRPNGVCTIEVPHLWKLLTECQFDTIYHEHFSYFSFHAIEGVLARHGLRAFDVESLPVHGGSIRVFACRSGAYHATHPRVETMRHLEADAITARVHYEAFQVRVDRHVRAFRNWLDQADGLVVGAGAPAKANTLLNAVGVTPDQMAFVTDTSPHKQGKFLPGSHLPICSPDVLAEHKPRYVVILTWNWAEEVMASLDFVKEWGAEFVLPIPEVRVL